MNALELANKYTFIQLVLMDKTPEVQKALNIQGKRAYKEFLKVMK